MLHLMDWAQYSYKNKKLKQGNQQRMRQDSSQVPSKGILKLKKKHLRRLGRARNPTTSSWQTERRLDEIRPHQQDDKVCRKLHEFSTEGWPVKSNWTQCLRRFGQKELVLRSREVSWWKTQDLSFLHLFVWTCWIQSTQVTKGFANVAIEPVSQFGGLVLANR